MNKMEDFPYLDFEKMERDFFVQRLEALVRQNADEVKPWVRVSSGKIRTLCHVVVPEDGEDYWEPMSLLKLQNDHYVLVQHSTGIIPSSTKLSSKDYFPLKEYGDRIFSSV